LAYDLVHIFDHAKYALELNPRASLGDLSERLRVERRTLERAFRKVSGKPFRQYQQGVLIRKSLELLASDNTLSIKEIAYSLGYKSPRAFARMIFLAFGSCPCKLRERLREAPAVPKTGPARKRAVKTVASGSLSDPD
jgi:AraC-like DNA-binding protein